MLTFTPAAPADAPLLGKLRQRCWAAAYRGIYPDDMIDQFDYAWHRQHDLARINSADFDVRIIREGSAAIGYMIVRRGHPPQLHSLYLLPEYQRRGVGRTAFARMTEYCRARNHPYFICQCQPENAPALAFYHRMGGVIITRDEGNEEPYMNSVTLRFDISKEDAPCATSLT